MSWLLTDKGKLYFRTNTDEFENKPFVILIHGAGNDGRVWMRLFPFLKEDLAVVIPDLPGHGKSEGEPADKIEDYFWVIDVLAQEFKKKKFFIGGHSMGGAIAFSYALNYPEKVEGSIILASSSSLPVNPQLLEMIKNNFELTASLSTQFSFYRKDKELDFFKNLTTEMIKSNGAETLYKDMIACNKYNIENLLDNLQTPLLIVAGEKDQMVSLKNIKNFADRIGKRTELNILPETGHMIILEDPEKVSELIHQFIFKLSTE